MKKMRSKQQYSKYGSISSNERGKHGWIGFVNRMKEKLISNRKWLALYYTLKESDKLFCDCYEQCIQFNI